MGTEPVSLAALRARLLRLRRRRGAGSPVSVTLSVALAKRLAEKGCDASNLGVMLRVVGGTFPDDLCAIADMDDPGSEVNECFRVAN